MRGRRTSRLHWLALWLGLFALYAATIHVDSFAGSDYGGDEPHYLLSAESLVTDGDVDLTDEYAARDYAGFYPYPLDVHGRPTNGAINEPHGVGFPLVIAPAYAIGGATGVELFLAALAALAFVLAAALARHVVPEPWATGAAVLVAVSPPAIAYGATVYPELVAGLLLAAASLLALRVRERPRNREALLAGALLAPLAWLGTKYAIGGLAVLAALTWWLLRRGRRLAALLAGEAVFASLVAYITVNGVLYDGLTPYAADRAGETATDAEFPLGYLERLPRLVALWIDREYGLLRWAPVLALAFAGAYLLWRSRRDRVARAVADQRDVEAAAALMLLVCAGQVLVAVLAPTMYGFWFPGRHLVAALPCAAVLVAWGLRHAPRAGAALAGLTVIASVWLLATVYLGEEDGWVTPATPAPWGPLERAFPLYGVDSAWADAVAAGAVTALLWLGVREWRAWREPAAERAA